MGNINSGEFTTFEVTLPRGVNDDTRALYGLGSALGWNISERVALPSDLHRDRYPTEFTITDDDLREISEDLWGDDVYGQNAVNALDEHKKNVW